MLKIKNTEVMDTVMALDIEQPLADRNVLKCEVHFELKFERDDIKVTPIRFGSVIERDPAKVLSQDHCTGTDMSGNDIVLIRDLSTQVDIALEYYPDEDDMAIWNIKKALLDHFHFPGSSISDEAWVAGIIQKLIDRSIPEAQIA